MITFIGAANAQFSKVFGLDGAAVEIGLYQSIPNNMNSTLMLLGDPLSISHIMSNTEGVKCTFNGVDNSVTVVEGAQTVDVGPPQTQISGSCVAE